MKKAYRIRPIKRGETGILLDLIKKLAEYEKLLHAVDATERLLNRSLFSRPARAEALLAFSGRTPVGFALFFNNFSTFRGRPGLYLEDIFVLPEHRGSGIGSRLLHRLAEMAAERDCARFEWVVLDWNEPAIQFYKKLGAVPLNDWTLFRLEGPNLKKLASKKKRV